jgi:hypothetical protein
VVAWHDEYRYACARDPLDWQKGSLYEFSRNTASVQQITAVHHTIHLFRYSDVHCVFEVGEKIVAAPAAFDTRTCRQVEAEVRVGKSEDADQSAAGAVGQHRSMTVGR